MRWCLVWLLETKKKKEREEENVQEKRGIKGKKGEREDGDKVQQLREILYNIWYYMVDVCAPLCNDDAR